MAHRNLTLILIIISLMIVSTGLTYALGVSSPYHKNKPLNMYPGQEKEISFNLQNCPSLSESCNKESVKVSVSLEEGEEIALVTSGEKYNVPYGSSDESIILKITIPSTAAIGAEYLVRFSIKSSSEDTNPGAVQLGTTYDVEFPVIIKDQSEIPVEYPAEKPGEIKFLIPALVILAIIILIIVVRLYKLLNKNKQTA